MTFNQEFLRELQQKLEGSNSYRMTKQSVMFLLKSKRLCEDDKKIIFSSLVNDISTNKDNDKDPLSLTIFWNTNICEPNLQFKF